MFSTRGQRQVPSLEFRRPIIGKLYRAGSKEQGEALQIPFPDLLKNQNPSPQDDLVTRNPGGYCVAFHYHRFALNEPQ